MSTEITDSQERYPHIYEYNENFKMAVVAEVITGQISQTAAKKKYGIGGHCTIERWIRRYGGNKELNKINKVRMPTDKIKIKELKQRIHQLEALLADLQLEKRALNKIIDLAEEEYKISIKKNSGPRRSGDSTKKTEE